MSYTVSQITAYLKNLLEGQPQLRNLEVEGEISEFRRVNHLYFTLIDRDARLSCVMFAGDMAMGMRCTVSEGLRVKVTGSIRVYPKGGAYQLYASRIEAVGAGAVNEQLLQLERRLRAEGLFDSEHKKPLPPYPQRVGLVTAYPSAVLEDMRRVFRERNPYIQLVLAPCRVQGVRASQEMLRALHRLERAGVDVIIIGRGGGGRETLLDFCDEQLVRAVYDCEIPVVSAVGHEINYMLIDYVADVQVQTPTMAAIAVAFSAEEYLGTLVNHHSSMVGAVCRSIDGERERLSHLQQILRYVSPAAQLERRRETLGQTERRMSEIASKAVADARRETAEAERGLRDALSESIRTYRNRLDRWETGLKAMSPYRLLEQGYAFVTVDGKPVKSIADLPKGARMKGYLTDGQFEADVVSTQARPEE